MLVYKNRFPLRAADDGAGGAAAPAGAAPAGAGAATPAPVAGAPAAAAGAPPAFADTLPVDIRESAVFRDIKNLEGLARSYENAARMVGLDKAKIAAIPNPEDAEGWNKLYGQLGRPEKADGYGFKPPDGIAVDQKLQDGFAGRAHELGLSAKQAQGLYEWWNAQAGEARAGMAGAAEQGKADAIAQLRRDWGGAFEQNVALAQKAVQHYAGGDPAVTRELEGPLGNAPGLAKVFAKMGAQLAEDGVIGRATAGPALHSPTEARQQIAAKQGDKTFMEAYRSKTHPQHQTALATMTGLYEQAYPNEQ